MASALEQLTQDYGTSSPVSYNDYYKAWMKDNHPKEYSEDLPDPNSFFGRIGNFFTGFATSARSAYDNYLKDYQYAREAASTAKANQETWEREDTQTQRLFEDYQKAGLNPYMILTGGNLSGGVVSSQAQRPQYKTKSKEEEIKAESKLMSAAIKVLALVLLKKAL